MNFFDDINHPLPGNETFDILLNDPRLVVERIASNGVKSGEWYDQAHDEWVLLVRGSAILEYDCGKTEQLGAGDHVFLPAHTPHRVLKTSEDALWLAVHLR